MTRTSIAGNPLLRKLTDDAYILDHPALLVPAEIPPGDCSLEYEAEQGAGAHDTIREP